MIMKIYKCDGINNDGSDCNITSDKTDNWITIGSKGNNSLCIENGLNDARLIQLNMYHDIHFCCKQCFINFIFQSETTENDQP